jgi:uncharacterized membrane protein YoaK (UPF0700 family)
LSHFLTDNSTLYQNLGFLLAGKSSPLNSTQQTARCVLQLCAIPGFVVGLVCGNSV